MQVELVSVEKRLWSGEASAVYARTPDGGLGIYPGHVPMLAALEPGWTVRIDRSDGDTLTVAVHGGFLSVRQDGVAVLAEIAETADEIDVARAEEALRRSEAEDTEDGREARARATARLRATGNLD